MITCNFLYSPLSLYKVSLFTFNIFRDMPRTNLLLQILERAITLKFLVIVSFLALCTFSDGRLLMYRFSLNSLPYNQIYAPEKFFTAKINKEVTPVNTGDRVMVLAFCNPPLSLHFHWWLSINVSSFIKLPSILLEICSRQNVVDGRTVRRMDKAATICSPFGEHKNK